MIVDINVYFDFGTRDVMSFFKFFAEFSLLQCCGFLCRSTNSLWNLSNSVFLLMLFFFSPPCMFPLDPDGKGNHQQLLLLTLMTAPPGLSYTSHLPRCVLPAALATQAQKSARSAAPQLAELTWITSQVPLAPLSRQFLSDRSPFLKLLCLLTAHWRHSYVRPAASTHSLFCPVCAALEFPTSFPHTLVRDPRLGQESSPS